MPDRQIVPDSSPALGYIASRYPFISHTFIQREILGLRAAGFRVETAAMVPAGPEHLLSPTDEDEKRRTLTIRPLGVGKIVRHLLAPIVRHPIDFLAIVRTSTQGWWLDPRAVVWRLFYAVEAILLWSMFASRGVGHIHAHHANVSANLAWLASDFGRRVGTGPTSWSMTMHGSAEFIDIDRIELGRKGDAAAGVACISDFTASQMMMVTEPETWDRFRVVHCGIDPTTYQPADDDRSDDGPFTVLFVGRLGAEKGLPLLVEATAHLRDALTTRETHLLVVGDGDWREAMEARCAELELSAEFVGAVGQHEIVPYYQRADAFCLTSFREGIPVVLMEAMACGVPCVAPNITAIPELIEHGESGLLATAGRSDQFGDHLLRLATDPALARKIGRAGREVVLSGFTTDDTIEGMVAFFDELGVGR